MAFNWPFSNYGFCGLLGISDTPFFIFANFSSAHPVAYDLLWMLTGNCERLSGVAVYHIMIHIGSVHLSISCTNSVGTVLEMSILTLREESRKFP